MMRSLRVRKNAPIIDLSSDSDSPQGKKRKVSDENSEDEYSVSPEDKKRKVSDESSEDEYSSSVESDSDDEYTAPKKSLKKVKEVSKMHKTASTAKSEDGAESKIEATKQKNSTLKSSTKRSRKVLESSSKEEEKVPKKKTKTTKDSASKKNEGGSSVQDSLPGTSTKKEAESLQMEWNEPHYLADLENIDRCIAAAVIKLFNEENTIPFIARYRKEITGNMTPEKLRQVKDSYESIKNIKHRAAVVTKTIEKTGKLTPELEHRIRCARDLHELDHLYAPFKPGTKRELAAKARMIGLEPPALTILEGTEQLDPKNLVDKNIKGRESVDLIEKGIQHIIADIMSKDTDVLAEIRILLKRAHIQVESKKAAKRAKTKDSEKSSKSASSENVESKFSDYFNFSIPLKFIKPHQVLALNRGEKLKELSVRIAVPEWIEWDIAKLCKNKWFQRGSMYPFRLTVLNKSVKDSYERLITPLITRQIRGEMNKEAERESVEVFARNLKNLLLTPPHKGHAVLAIDPGFRHGCKTAMVSATGALLEYCVMNFNSKNSSKEFKDDEFLKGLMRKHNCELIAIGNGQGCRQTEEHISSLIQRNFFRPLDVQYTIVDEQGVSIYSCSEEAAKEFPDLDPTVRSAISIARRLQDPLSEMVKVEPKHLGVGMYQHDLPEKVLSSTLQEVVIECVSFVGVDLNTAPHCLLKQIAGLGTVRATRVIEWREKNGSFFTRDQLNEVKGIGKKSFEQCAGFVRILPDTIESTDRWKLDPLDRTCIHPESYPFAKKFVDDNDIDLNDLGSTEFRRKVQEAVSKSGGEKSIALKYKISEVLADFVVRGLLAPVNQDFRSEQSKPIFRKGVTSMSDLKEGTLVTGRVTNTTSFGAFLDIGVGRNGLIHTSCMKGQTLNLGDHVEVTVKNVDVNRGRIGLILVQKLGKK